MGNGLIQDRMEEHRRRRATCSPCIVEWGGSNVGPGRLVRDSIGGYMVGELDGAERRAHAAARALPGAGRADAADATTCAGMIWSKLLVNSTFTGLSAVSGLRYGGVAEHGAATPSTRSGPRASRSADAQGLTLESSTTSTRTSFDRDDARSRG